MNEPLARAGHSILQPGRGIESLAIGLQYPRLLVMEKHAKEPALAPSGNRSDRRNIADDKTKRADIGHWFFKPEARADA